MTDPTPRAREEGDTVTIPRALAHRADGLLSLIAYRYRTNATLPQDLRDDLIATSDEFRRIAALRAVPAEAEGEDVDRCAVCGQSASCCVTAIGAVGDGVPLDSIGVDEGATTLYTGACVRALLDRAPTSPRAGAAGEVTEAMVEAFRATWDGQKTIEKDNRERIRVSLTAALRAARGGGAG